MVKRNYLEISVLVLALFLSAVAPAFANNKRDVTLDYDVVLRGTTLPAGRYTINWESHNETATVTVSKKKQVLATAEAKVVERGKMYQRNAVVLEKLSDGTLSIREIRPAGLSHAIVFYE